MKILFAGAGALGARFAYMLHKSGEDVTLIDGWADHIQKIREHGLHAIIDGKDEGFHKIPIYPLEELEGQFDVVFVAVKSARLRPTMENIAPFIHENTKILCLLNGLGHVDTLQEFVRPENILIGVTIWTSGLGGAGVLNAVGSGTVELKQVREDDSISTTHALIEACNRAGMNVIYSADVFESIWTKAALNCVMNSYCTLIDCNVHEYGTYPHNQELTDMVLNEVIAVGTAEGVNVDHDEVSRRIRGVFPIEKSGLHYPSMHQDMKNGRLTEIDFLNGAISRLGRKHGIPTPVCDVITHMIHAKEIVNGNK